MILKVKKVLSVILMSALLLNDTMIINAATTQEPFEQEVRILDEEETLSAKQQSSESVEEEIVETESETDKEQEKETVNKETEADEKTKEGNGTEEEESEGAETVEGESADSAQSEAKPKITNVNYINSNSVEVQFTFPNELKEGDSFYFGYGYSKEEISNSRKLPSEEVTQSGNTYTYRYSSQGWLEFIGKLYFRVGFLKAGMSDADVCYCDPYEAEMPALAAGFEETSYQDAYFVDENGNKIEKLTIHVGESKKIQAVLVKENGEKVPFETKLDNTEDWANDVQWNILYQGSWGFDYLSYLLTEEIFDTKSERYIKGKAEQENCYVYVSRYMDGILLELCMPVEIIAAEDGKEYPQPEEATVCKTREEAYQKGRDLIRNRENGFVAVEEGAFDNNDGNASFESIMMDSYQEREGMKPDEGDYAFCHIGYLDKKNGEWFNFIIANPSDLAIRLDTYEYVFYRVFRFETPYLTTREQEDKVDAKIKSLLSEGGELYFKENVSDIEKAAKILNYIQKHVSYIGSRDPKYHTCYSALIDGRGTCEAYSLLYMRLARECGMACKLIQTDLDASNNTHAFNIIQADGKWYCADPSGNIGLSDGAMIKNRKLQAQYTDRKFVNAYLCKIDGSGFNYAGDGKATVIVDETETEYDSMAEAYKAILNSEKEEETQKNYIIRAEGDVYPEGQIFDYSPANSGSDNLRDRVTIDLNGYSVFLLDSSNVSYVNFKCNTLKNGKIIQDGWTQANICASRVLSVEFKSSTNSNMFYIVPRILCTAPDAGSILIDKNSKIAEEQEVVLAEDTVMECGLNLSTLIIGGEAEFEEEVHTGTLSMENSAEAYFDQKIVTEAISLEKSSLNNLHADNAPLIALSQKNEATIEVSKELHCKKDTDNASGKWFKLATYIINDEGKKEIVPWKSGALISKNFSNIQNIYKTNDYDCNEEKEATITITESNIANIIDILMMPEKGFALYENKTLSVGTESVKVSFCDGDTEITAAYTGLDKAISSIGTETKSQKGTYRFILTDDCSVNKMVTFPTFMTEIEITAEQEESDITAEQEESDITTEQEPKTLNLRGYGFKATGKLKLDGTVNITSDDNAKGITASGGILIAEGARQVMTAPVTAMYVELGDRALLETNTLIQSDSRQKTVLHNQSQFVIRQKAVLYNVQLPETDSPEEKKAFLYKLSGSEIQLNGKITSEGQKLHIGILGENYDCNNLDNSVRNSEKNEVLFTTTEKECQLDSIILNQSVNPEYDTVYQNGNTICAGKIYFSVYNEADNAETWLADFVKWTDVVAYINKYGNRKGNYVVEIKDNTTFETTTLPTNLSVLTFRGSNKNNENSESNNKFALNFKAGLSPTIGIGFDGLKVSAKSLNCKTLTMTNSSLDTTTVMAITSMLTMKNSKLIAGTQMKLSNVLSLDDKNVLEYDGSGKNVLTISGTVKAPQDGCKECDAVINSETTICIHKNALVLKPQSVPENGMLCKAAKVSPSWFVYYNRSDESENTVITDGVRKIKDSLYRGIGEDGNVILKASETEENYTTENYYSSLQEAFTEIDQLGDNSRFYQIVLKADIVENGKSLKFPTKTAGVTITGEKEENTSGYSALAQITFNGDLTCKSNITLQNVKMFRETGESIAIKTSGNNLKIKDVVCFNQPLKLDGGKYGEFILEGSLFATKQAESKFSDNKSYVEGTILNLRNMETAGDFELAGYAVTVKGKTTYKNSELKTTDLVVDGVTMHVIGGKATIDNLTFTGTNPVIWADLDFKITKSLENNADNATIKTRRKKDQSPYLVVDGIVRLSDRTKKIKVGVYPEWTYDANRAESSEDSEAEGNINTPVTLGGAPDKTAILLSGKNTSISGFEPLNAGTPYSDDEPDGYMLVKIKTSIYVYVGANVEVELYQFDSSVTYPACLDSQHLLGYYRSMSEAVTEINAIKNNSWNYAIVFKKDQGSEEKPVTWSLPTYAETLYITGKPARGEDNKEIKIYHAKDISLECNTVIDGVAIIPQNKLNEISFSLKNNNLHLNNIYISGRIKNITGGDGVILEDVSSEDSKTNTIINGDVSRVGRITINNPTEVKGNISVTDLVMKNSLKAGGTILVSENIEHYPDADAGAYSLSYGKNISRLTPMLTVQGYIRNNSTDKKLILNLSTDVITDKKGNITFLPGWEWMALDKQGYRITLTEAKKFAILKKASTDSFTLQLNGKSMDENSYTTVKASGSVFVMNSSLFEENGVKLTETTDEGSKVETMCLDFNQGSNEICVQQHRSSKYTINAYQGKDSENPSITDTNLTDLKQYSLVAMPKTNSASQLKLDSISMTYTGTISITVPTEFNQMELHAKKLGKEITDAPVSINASQRNTPISFINCKTMILDGGLTSKYKLILDDTVLRISKGNIATLILKNAGLEAFGKTNIQDIEVQDGVDKQKTKSYIASGILGDKGTTYLNLKGNVTNGIVKCVLYSYDKTYKLSDAPTQMSDYNEKILIRVSYRFSNLQDFYIDGYELYVEKGAVKARKTSA